MEDAPECYLTAYNEGDVKQIVESSPGDTSLNSDRDIGNLLGEKD